MPPLRCVQGVHDVPQSPSAVADAALSCVLCIFIADINACANAPCDTMTGANIRSCIDSAPPANGVTGFTCTCKPGYTWNTTTTTCTGESSIAVLIRTSCKLSSLYHCAVTLAAVWQAAQEGGPASLLRTQLDRWARIAGPVLSQKWPEGPYSMCKNNLTMWPLLSCLFSDCTEVDGCANNPCIGVVGQTGCIDKAGEGAELYSCSCADGRQWNATNRTCDGACSKTSRLFVATGSKV